MGKIILFVGQSNVGKTYIAEKLRRTILDGKWTRFEFMDVDLASLKPLQGKPCLVLGLTDPIVEHLYADEKIDIPRSADISAFRPLWEQTIDAVHKAHGTDYLCRTLVARISLLMQANPEHVILVPDLHYRKEIELLYHHFSDIAKVLVHAPKRSSLACDAELNYDFNRMLTYRPHSSETDLQEYFEDKKLAQRYGFICFDNDLDTQTEKSFTKFNKMMPPERQIKPMTYEEAEKEMQDKGLL
jgi:hypothetical protein